MSSNCIQAFNSFTQSLGGSDLAVKFMVCNAQAGNAGDWKKILRWEIVLIVFRSEVTAVNVKGAKVDSD